LKVDPAKVDTVWLGGAGPEFHAAPAPERVKALGVSGPYLLFVSALNNRKNLPRLVQAFAKLKEKGSKHSLVMVGRPDASAVPLKEEVAKLGVASSVKFFEALPQEDLVALYRGADLFVYPSILEGFGLPVIEAMACEVPVVVANASCMPEIAGDAALFFDGNDADDLARQLERGLNDKDLRADLIGKGRARAALFDWTTCATGTLASYQNALSK